MDEVIKITKGSRELYISYGKSFSKGVDPKIKKLEKALDDEELNIRENKNRKIICIFEEIMKVNLIYNGLIKSGYFFILCDTEGYIIKLIYDDHLANYFKKINLVEGASLRLEDSGTNAINLAMEYKSRVEICGEDHYCELLKNWYCTAMPIINYNDTAIIAYLDMSCVNYRVAAGRPISFRGWDESSDF